MAQIENSIKIYLDFLWTLTINIYIYIYRLDCNPCLRMKIFNSSYNKVVLTKIIVVIIFEFVFSIMNGLCWIHAKTFHSSHAHSAFGSFSIFYFLNVNTFHSSQFRVFYIFLWDLIFQSLKYLGLWWDLPHKILPREL